MFTSFFSRETSESKECCHIGKARLPYCSLEIRVDIKCSKALTETKIILKYFEFYRLSFFLLEQALWYLMNPQASDEREERTCLFISSYHVDSISLSPFLPLTLSLLTGKNKVVVTPEQPSHCHTYRPEVRILLCLSS